MNGEPFCSILVLIFHFDFLSKLLLRRMTYGILARYLLVLYLGSVYYTYSERMWRLLDTYSVLDMTQTVEVHVLLG